MFLSLSVCYISHLIPPTPPLLKYSTVFLLSLPFSPILSLSLARAPFLSLSSSLRSLKFPSSKVLLLDILVSVFHRKRGIKSIWRVPEAAKNACENNSMYHLLTKSGWYSPSCAILLIWKGLSNSTRSLSFLTT